MDDEPLHSIGHPRNALRGIDGRFLPQPDKRQNVTLRGNSRTYIIQRLSKDGRFDLVALVRNREISARQALAQSRPNTIGTAKSASTSACECKMLNRISHTIPGAIRYLYGFDGKARHYMSDDGFIFSLNAVPVAFSTLTTTRVSTALTAACYTPRRDRAQAWRRP